MAKNKFKWMVEFTVSEDWVADGFMMTDQRALEMLASALSYADMGVELHARVVAQPTAKSIATAQGYKDTRVVSKTWTDGLLVHQEDNPLELLRRTIMFAHKKLDSVAFLEKEGDTDGIKADLLRAAGQIANGFQSV